MSPRERARHGARFPHHPCVTRQGRCGDVSPGCASRARAGMTRDDATRCDAPARTSRGWSRGVVHQLTSHDSRGVGQSCPRNAHECARIDASVRDVARGAGVDASRRDDFVKRAFA